MTNRLARSLAPASAAAFVAVLVLACSVRAQEANGDAPAAAPAAAPPAQTAQAAPSDDAPAGDAPTGDAPEISRSVGEEGGVVVFWPRVVSQAVGDHSLQRVEPLDDETRALATAVQEELRALVERALPGQPIDVRPEPERVCPLAGCTAMTVGVVLARRDAGCAAIAVVSGPGQAEASLVPWAAAVRLDHDRVSFRAPPESEVTVTDFARCDSLVESLAAREEVIVEAIRAAAQAGGE